MGHDLWLFLLLAHIDEHGVMGKSFTPIFASESTAAKLLDMRPADFRTLVDAGALPRPVRLTDTVERWRVEDLDAILQGKLPKPRETFEL